MSKIPYRYSRGLLSILYLIISLVLINLGLESANPGRIRVFEDAFNKFIWCYGFSLLGFALLSFKAIKRGKSPFPSFIFYYPITLAIIAALIFSISYLLGSASRVVFYYLSAPLCVIFSFRIDSFEYMVDKTIKKFAGIK